MTYRHEGLRFTRLEDGCVRIDRLVDAPVERGNAYKLSHFEQVAVIHPIHWQELVEALGAVDWRTTEAAAYVHA